MRRSWLQSLGPGLLWAGTAIGVSHLVQSTRAGAGFGLALLWLVIAANAFKYPAFEAGPRYASATGRSLLEGYRRLGTWALVVFLILTVSTMFTVIAAVTAVTAGMASALLTDAIPIPVWSLLLLGLTALILGVGRYRLLDAFMKVMMVLLTTSTVVTFVALIPQVRVESLVFWPPVPDLKPSTLIFLCALAGWMPSALDTAVWQSLWGLEKARTQGRTWEPAEAQLDFNIGYVGTSILAILFVMIGAFVLYGTGTTLPDGAAAFAETLVSMYTQALGDWSRPVILIAAFATMLSTTISVTDGFPRALEGALLRLTRGPEGEATPRTWMYWAALGVCIAGALGLLVFLGAQLKLLVTIATVLTGLTGTLFGVLNLMVLRGDEVPAEHRPSPAYTAFHIAGIVFMAGLGVLLVVAMALQSMGA